MASNANVVQWSDDSYSLVIGGTEIFDLNMHPVRKDEHLHIFAQHQSASLMEDVGVILEKIFLRPVGVSSMANKLSRSHSESKVKMAFMPQDPETQRLEMEKIAIEKQKIKQKQEAEQRKFEDRQLKRETSRFSYITKEWLEDTERRSKKKSHTYEEDEDEEEEDGDYEEEDGDEDDDEEEDDDEKEEDGEGEEEEEGEDVSQGSVDSDSNGYEKESSEPNKPIVKRGVVISDSDDDDE